MLIDATLEASHAAAGACRREPFMRSARDIWKELGLPALTVRPPWHGYSLGDWNESWDVFARNAAAGEWEKNGANTFAAGAAASSRKLR